MVRCRTSPGFAPQARRRRTAMVVAAALAALVGSLLTGVAGAAPASADGPGAGAPWVVSLGDSYVSGEAGRWAGSTNLAAAAPTRSARRRTTTTPPAPPSRSTGATAAGAAEGAIGGGVRSLNLACSGAKTSTYTTLTGHFKPGLDFADDGPDRQGQAAMLRDVRRARHDVQMVAGLDRRQRLRLRDGVQQSRRRTSSPRRVLHELLQRRPLGQGELHRRQRRGGAGPDRHGVRTSGTAMRNAGYADTAWTMLVQNYPSPIPPGAGFRYSQSGYTRQSTGGCGFWNADADWANRTALPTINTDRHRAVGRIRHHQRQDARPVLGASTAAGCARSTVGLYEEKGLTSWTQPGAVDRTEWVNQIRTVSTASAARTTSRSRCTRTTGRSWRPARCVRQAWNAGTPRGGTCAIAGHRPGRRASPGWC